MCRFINADGIDYLGMGDELLAFNLFSYCGNNPVMGYDPMGTFNCKNLVLSVAVVVTVTLVVVATVATAGAAAVALGASASIVSSMVSGAAVGGLIAGGFSVADQFLDYGGDNINFEELAVTTLCGAVRGTVDNITGIGKAARFGINSLICGVENAWVAKRKGKNGSEIQYAFKSGLSSNSIAWMIGYGASQIFCPPAKELFTKVATHEAVNGFGNLLHRGNLK